ATSPGGCGGPPGSCRNCCKPYHPPAPRARFRVIVRALRVESLQPGAVACGIKSSHCRKLRKRVTVRVVQPTRRRRSPMPTRGRTWTSLLATSALLVSGLSAALVPQIALAAPPAAPAPAAVPAAEGRTATLVGSLQSELGCPGDWQAD